MPSCPVSRREFLQAAAAAAAITTLGPAAALGQAPRPRRSFPRRFVIDAHQHFSPDARYFDWLVPTYRKHNAMACVNGWLREFPAILEGAKKFPDVVIPYGRINPDAGGAAAEVEHFAKNGARGIKLHSPKFDWDDERYFPIYERIEKHAMMALFHTGITTAGMARMRPSFIHTISVKFPELHILGAHLGNPWYTEAAEVARLRPKVYWDVTGSTLIKTERNLKQFKDYLWWEGPTNHSSPQAVHAFEKILFGTDEQPGQEEKGMGLENMLGRYEELFDACGVPEPVRQKSFGATMARILKIPVRVA
ncbi:MAG: amidohydrolase family protein [Opitutaceae bacterium]|nr:amidohydrolase family protein [Opitutaceae bacterium]